MRHLILYIGSKEALDAMLDVHQHPMGGHLAYAVTTSLGSHSLRRHWEKNPEYNVERLIKRALQARQLREPKPNAK